MSLDKAYVRWGESGDEEGVRLKISYCNFRYVYYTHSGILIHSGLRKQHTFDNSHTPQHTWNACMYMHSAAHSHFSLASSLSSFLSRTPTHMFSFYLVSFSFCLSCGSNFFFHLSEEIRNGREKSGSSSCLSRGWERAGLFSMALVCWKLQLDLTISLVNCSPRVRHRRRQ